MSDRELLFNRFALSDIIRHSRDRIPQQIFEEKRDYLLGVNEETYIFHLVGEYTIDALSLHRDRIEIAHQSDEVVPVDDFGRVINLRRNFITFSVPFSGERELFFAQPSTFSTNPPRAQVGPSELMIKILNPNDDATKLRAELDGILSKIDQYIAWQKSEIETWNAGLRGLIESIFLPRKGKLLKEVGAVQSLGFPLRKRADLPASYSVPVTRKKISISKPAASTVPYQAQPLLDDDQYHDILGILRNMVLVMERTPQAFATMGEETLRNHFLVQLNGLFEGSATGETFNFQGKTDILIRKDQKNLFVAECKFWSGAKGFNETIDQLLNYLTWRDAKVATLVFVRDVNISTVIEQIPGLLSSHPNFLKALPRAQDGEFGALMKSTRDPAVSLVLTVQAYHIPKPS